MNHRRTLFSAEIADGIYLISSGRKAGIPLEKIMKPQKATANSYLIVGDEKALLFDLAVNKEGLWEYACSLTDKPIMLALSHGHVDHIFYLNKRKEVWLHPADMEMVKNGIPGINPPTEPCPFMRELNEGDVVELGNRQLSVYHIPGHTPGSILLLDHKTKIMLSGDSIARRLLFGVGSKVDLPSFSDKVKRLKSVNFECAYSAHDRCAIPKKHLDRILQSIECVQKGGKRKKLPLAGEFLTYKYGRESQLDFCDVAVFYSRRSSGEGDSYS